MNILHNNVMRRYDVGPWIAAALLLGLTSCTSTLRVPAPDIPSDSLAYGDIAMQTDLYFGLSRSDGGMVSENEWRGFLDSTITPRFPDGLTVLDVRGQWRGADGRIITEPSKVVILIHPANTLRDGAIEEIRELYRKRFMQESVMRISRYVWVKF
jgi:hypothetical protein